MIPKSHSYVTMVSGQSWMRRGERLVAGDNTSMTPVRWKSRRTSTTWQQTLQSETQTLLEALGSLHGHPSGIGHRLQTVTTNTATVGFLSYRQDPQPLPTRLGSLTEGQTGTPHHHSVTPHRCLVTLPIQPPAHPNPHLMALGISHTPHPRSYHGVQVISQPPPPAHQAISNIGKPRLPVCTPILLLFTLLMVQSLLELPASGPTKQ